MPGMPLERLPYWAATVAEARNSAGMACVQRPRDGDRALPAVARRTWPARGRGRARCRTRPSARRRTKSSTVLRAREVALPGGRRHRSRRL